MKPLFVVPGFAGSELRVGNAEGRKYWVSPATLVAGGMFRMRLHDNGVDPHPGNGVSLVGGKPLEDFYDPLIDRLKSDLEDDGYEIKPWGWDWRKSIAGSAERLAADIEAAATPQEPAVLVAHSAGGLVSRRAYWELKQKGKENLVRRIVTLGTPHSGTYAPIDVFCKDNETVNQITGATGLAQYVIGKPPSYIPAPVPSKEKFSEIFGTWPGLYDLMPLIDQKGTEIDPNLPTAYQSGNYPEDHGVKSKWLDHTQIHWHTWLRSEESKPPPWVLTCVAGDGYETTNRVTDPLKLGTPQALGTTTDGDGTVTLHSALLPGVPHVTVSVDHQGLTVKDDALDLLKDLVLEVRQPGNTSSPSTTVPGQPTAAVPGPPFPGALPHLVLNEQGQTVGESPPVAAGVQPPAVFIPSFTGGRTMYHVAIVWNQTDRAHAEWTENFWADVSNVDAAIDAGKVLAGVMEELHGQATNWIRVEARKVRGSDNVEVEKDQDYFSRPFTSQVKEDATYSDQATAAIFIRLYGGPDYTQQWIKGIQDRWVDKNGVLYKASTSFKDAVKSFKNAITQDPWRIRCLDDDIKKKPVINITQAGVVELTNHNYDPIFPVRISGSKSNKYVNNIWEISALSPADANKFKLNFFAPPDPWIPPKGKIRARQQRYVFKKITAVQTIHASSHKVGGPKKKYVGSKRAARS